MRLGIVLFLFASLVGQRSHAAIAVDGALAGDELRYGAALSVQNTNTGYGNAVNGDPRYANGGSEIDRVFATVADDRLYVLIAGNLESNFNKLNVFIDSVPGGVNQIVGSGLPGQVDPYCCGGNGALQQYNGLRFDAGFEADHFLAFSNGNHTFGAGINIWTLTAYYADLTQGAAGGKSEIGFQRFASGVEPGFGVGVPIDQLNNGCSGPGDRGCNPLEHEFAEPIDTTGDPSNARGHRDFLNDVGLLMAINNSNTAGVNSGTGAATGNPGAVATGVEFSLPLSVLGNPMGDIRIAAFIGSGNHNNVSNQVAGAGVLRSNLGSPASINLAAIAGNQYVSVTAPWSDFNGDIRVDGGDFLIWQRGAGAGASRATGDADGNGAVDGSDLAVWQTQFGHGAGAASVVGVAEPTGLALPVCCLVFEALRRTRGRRRILGAMAFLGGLIAIHGYASAALLVRDQFLAGGSPTAGQYAIASIIGQNPTIAGFTGPWYTSNGSSMDVAAGSLSYSAGNYPTSAGNRLFSNDNANRVHRLFDATINPFQSNDAGVVYMSLLVQTTASSGNAYIAVEFHNGGNADGNRSFQLGVSQGSTDFPNGANFGFRINNNSASLSRALGTRNATVNLFLVKFNLSTSVSGDSMTVWQNPTVASLVTDPAGGVVVSGFDFVADRMGVARFNSASTSDFSVDELRIGTTLGDVLSNGFLACDVNGNGVCNSTDMRILSDHMYQPGGFADGDLNGDGLVDFADYRLLKDDPQRVVGFDPPEAANDQVPEPTSALLALVAAFLVVRGLFSPGLAGRPKCMMLGLVLIWAGVSSRTAHAQTRPTGPITTFSGATLQMKRYASIPTGPIISMSTQPLAAGNHDLFVATQSGNIYELNPNGGGAVSTSLFFNYDAAVSQFVVNPANGFLLDNTNTTHGGLRNISFHPDFALNGKFYTSALVDSPTGVSGLHYLGPQIANPAAESVVAEWTYNRVTDQLTDYRELFRVQMPVFDHPVKQMGFDPFARPGDEDYGLLYIAHGDGSVASTTTGGGAPNNALGKILRINPLQAGTSPYTTPGNVLANQPGYLPEIYTLGHRNPHHLSFARDAGGATHVIVAEPGRDNIEEVNILQNGGNYGWSSREGTWVQVAGSGGFGVGVGLQNLPTNEWQLNDFIYPAAQYDHDTSFGTGFSGVSIAGGFVIQNHSDPALENQYIFLDFANANGRVYQAGLDNLLSAHTQLADGELPSALTQAPISRLHLTLDADGNGSVDRTADDMNSLLQVSRNDARFGRGTDGQMFISSKTTGQVYLVNNTVPQVNRLTLTVDRATGAMTLSNNSGGNVAIDGLSLTSPSGSLVPSSLQAVGPGFSVSGGSTDQSVRQNSASMPLVVGASASIDLGTAYDPQLYAFGRPAGDDVVFVFETATGDAVLGNVVYTGESGIPDTIVMTINPATGQASLRNETPYAQEVEGYTISSSLGSLDPDSWLSFESQGIDDGDWFASGASDSMRLTEFQENGTTTFNASSTFQLGHIYAPGSPRDLHFEFLLAGDSAPREGLVVYQLPGDFDHDSDVDGGDFLVWQRGLSPIPHSSSDLANWSANFGLAYAVSPLAATVPEPASEALLSLVLWTGVWRMLYDRNTR